MLVLCTAASPATLKDIRYLICSYCICYTTNSTATDFWNVSDVKCIFKEQCNSLPLPAQPLATARANTCDTAVAAMAPPLAPQLRFKVGMERFCLTCTVRNQQRDTYRLLWRAGSRQLCVSGIARDSWAAWYSLRPHLLYLWMLLHWWDGLLSFLKYTSLLFLNNNEFRNKSGCVVLIIYLWDLRGKNAT